ncbi:FeoA family protein [Tumebacillus lipolyticus]|uniref:Ferrous iron transport protein A n=1 Tax=Tumebacillus lipolyticus TaxID=1280370 RepID=A0ABW5A1T0_9BACL
METIPLTQLAIGERARVISLLATGQQRRRMLDLGLVPQAMIEALRKSPAGDPVAYRIRGAVIALRREEASLVTVARI